MDALTLDQVMSSSLPTDFLNYLNMLWALFPAGILLSVIAWLVSITVYTVLAIFNKA